ncbi:MAG: 16S rRNA (adenine(1518)-N(6)/adenine(1519)-N(6))-dimethyltransferase RsmA [Candidatus Nealsonbacteria bacterium]
MDLTNKQNIQALLKKHGLKPRKGLGQNFLVNPQVLEKLIATAEINIKDTVLEIGPGTGAITQALAQKAKRVIAVEKDREMVKILKETLKGFENIEIICDDIRRSDLPLNFGGDPTSQKYKVVGNLPFYLTAPVIRMFLEMSEAKPHSLTLVVQKEVAQRICAKPPKMSILANSVQFYADPELISVIPKESFFPQPKVDAAIIKITPNGSRTVLDPSNKDLFFKIMKAGFSHPRKQLLNNLAQELKKSREDVAAWLQKNNINPKQRAETLGVDDWIRLAKSYKINQ